jgi:signal transduction histidine kinase
MNLLCNAIDALEESNVERVKGEDAQNNLQPANLQPSIPCIWIRTEVIKRGSNNDHAVDSVVIRITDNGPGIAEDVRVHIFDPFFTTKPAGKGTGLGLSISYQFIVEKHGGQLTCVSAPDQGTEFAIELPIQQSRA